MLIVPMASFRPREVPTVRLEELDNFPDLHPFEPLSRPESQGFEYSPEESLH